MVIAGPGTGKTTVLALRIANILHMTDTAPDSILALTFTDSGASSMRRKLITMIGKSAYYVNIHTFHGFAERIIGEYPDFFPRIIGSKIITDAEQISIVEEIVRSKKIDLLRPSGDPVYYVKPILREIQTLKRENITPDIFVSSLDKEEEKQNAKNVELGWVYAEYEKELARGKFYDFDDMLLELVRAMEKNNDFKRSLQENFQYILADEHQDANAVQNRILEFLADFHDMPNLFIVGDEKQAIYRFQGASLQNFLYFSKKYPKAEVIDLRHNYRSHQLILDASHGLIKNNPNIPGKKNENLIALQIGGERISVVETATSEDELAFVTDSIKDIIEEGRKPEEIAVLYRDNNHARGISTFLRSSGIPYRIESNNNLENSVDVQKIIILCQAINDPSNGGYLANALFLGIRDSDPGDVAELCAIATREKKPLYGFVKKAKSKEIRKVYADIVSWSRQARTMQFMDFLDILIRQTGLLVEIIKSSDSEERMSSLQRFYSLIADIARSRRDFRLSDFVRYITLAREHGLLFKHGYSENAGGVRLMTAHRAKGLEFDCVFIIHAVNGIWGNRSIRNLFTIPIVEHARDTGRIEDERRLFYVAMTRARRDVVISYSRSIGGKDAIPSQFVGEIPIETVAFTRLPDGASRSYFDSLAHIPARISSIANPSFIKKTFLNQPFSVTHLNNFLKCPWRYFFVNLLRIPQTESVHQLYGTAVHGALRDLFKSYAKGKTMSKKQFLESFKRELDRANLSEDTRESLRKKGLAALEGYYASCDFSEGRKILTEHSVNGNSIVLDDKTGERLELSGKLDKVEFIDDVNVIVTDYKTGKPKSRNEIEGKTANSNGNYKRQLVFYKLLLADNVKKFRMKYGAIDFVEPNPRGIYKKERFEIKDEEVDELKKLILKTAKSILDMSFLNSVCDDHDCEYCRLGGVVG